MKDYYRILGVARTATEDEIKKAYRKLASQHHPDKGGDKSRFQEVQEAYSVLGDAQKRAEYDNPRPQMNFGSMGGHPGFDFNEIFEMFGVNPRRQQQGQARISIWIGIEDVARGGPRLIALQMGGQVHNVEIDVPVGLNDGDTIRYAKLAPGGHDLVVSYRIRPDFRWEREGKDITTERTVNVWDLVLGCEITIEDPAGRELILTVPPRTQPGSKLRVKGRGLPARQLPGDPAGQSVGDLFVRVQARLPDEIPESIILAIKQHLGR